MVTAAEADRVIAEDKVIDANLSWRVERNTQAFRLQVDVICRIQANCYPCVATLAHPIAVSPFCTETRPYANIRFTTTNRTETR